MIPEEFRRRVLMVLGDVQVQRGALISECGLYRYRLFRHWDAMRPALVFVMLNPSVADGLVDDATVRKCIGFAHRLGYGSIEVINLFAFRATKPAALKSAGYPVGPDNDRNIIEVCASRRVVCAWGSNARGLERASAVLQLLRRIGATPMALKLTPDGVPWHPLMLSYEVDGKTRELVEMPS